MIIVEIKVPALGESYDFQLDENTKVEGLLAEICEILCKKTKSVLNSKEKSFMLFSIRQECELDKNRSLVQNGIIEGDLLLLV